MSLKTVIQIVQTNAEQGSNVTTDMYSPRFFNKFFTLRIFLFTPFKSNYLNDPTSCMIRLPVWSNYLYDPTTCMIRLPACGDRRSFSNSLFITYIHCIYWLHPVCWCGYGYALTRAGSVIREDILIINLLRFFCSLGPDIRYVDTQSHWIVRFQPLKYQGLLILRFS